MTPASSSLSDLRERVRALELGGRAPGRVLPLGLGAIDAALPGGGLPLGALHDVQGAGPDEEDAILPAAFAACLLGRLDGAGAALWCHGRGDHYAPGLAGCGVERPVVFARGRSDAEVLWAMEEGLRGGPVAVIGELGALDGVAGRRLLLAAEASGVMALVLRRWRTGALAAKHRAAPSVATTRWRIAAVPGAEEGDEPGLGPSLWRLDLLRCRGGAPGSWVVDAASFIAAPAIPSPRWGERTMRRGSGEIQAASGS